jgi:hypothetical protein
MVFWRDPLYPSKYIPSRIFIDYVYGSVNGRSSPTLILDYGSRDFPNDGSIVPILLNRIEAFITADSISSALNTSHFELDLHIS